jgi:prolyl-tRNA editing enzyme YbaK/EbsC (Cys-tRNA(Pro) deacylase)
MTQEGGASRSAVDRVREALTRLGVEGSVVEFRTSTRTAQEAADTVGTTVAQIAKSLIFLAGGAPVLVIASGKNRVSEKKLKARLGAKIRRADADQVRDATGYAIGGVPPVGHSRPLRTLIDEDLLAFQEIYAAAGTPRAVFRLTPQELLRITGGEAVDLKDEVQEKK